MLFSIKKTDRMKAKGELWRKWWLRAGGYRRKSNYGWQTDIIKVFPVPLVPVYLLPKSFAGQLYQELFILEGWGNRRNMRMNNLLTGR